ncbi:MAG: hypothetical protein JNL82_14310 [Myxococcales bacterium]|nr:hypothetical protein [Myxococcales bacterium]
MRRLNHLVSLALLALVACSNSPSGPPASPQPTPAPAENPPAGEAPAASAGETPQPPPGVVVSPKPPADAPAPAEEPKSGEVVTCTPDKRKGGVCTREFRPVCGSYADNTTKTFANPCVACSDEKVVSHVAGKCPEAS